MTREQTLALAAWIALADASGQISQREQLPPEWAWPEMAALGKHFKRLEHIHVSSRGPHVSAR